MAVFACLIVGFYVGLMLLTGQAPVAGFLRLNFVYRRETPVKYWLLMTFYGGVAALIVGGFVADDWPGLVDAVQRWLSSLQG